MSESIHAGHLPLWNPYINFGIPQYGDMSSGYWSPVTWLFASTVGYNAYTLTLEVLLYILIGGLGMYKLSAVWIEDKHVRLLAGIVYMCSGYSIGHLQHFNWISGAAFLPFCLYSYTLLLRNFSIRNAVLLSLFFYMLVASAHPGITISAFYFFIGTGCFYFFKNEHKISFSARIRNIGKSHITFFVLFLLLSAGMLTGYLDIIPHFIRGEKIGLEESLSNPTNIQSWISALLPFSTVKNDAFYNTDPSMRNSYFSITLVLFLLVACIKKKTSWQYFFLCTGILFCLLSSGGIFKTIAYKVVPFIGYIRLNGEFRIFAILCFILVASIELDKFIQQKKKFEGTIKLLYYILELIIFYAIVFGIYKAVSNKESFLYNTKNIFNQQSVSLKLKALIDAVSYYDTFWIQGVLQLLFLWGIKWCLKFGDWNLLKKLTIINMIVCSLLNIPFTGVGKSSVAEVQAVLNKAPKGIPVPDLHPISKNDTLNINEKGLVGDWSFYNKQPGVKKEAPYPITLKNMKDYFEKNNEGTGVNYLDKPFIFITNANSSSQISISEFTGSKIKASVNTDLSSQLVVQQNFYPHWYYEKKNTKKEVDKAGINFMSAPVEPGNNNVVFSFEPVLVKWMMLLSLLSFIILLIIVMIKRPTRSFPS